MLQLYYSLILTPQPTPILVHHEHMVRIGLLVEDKFPETPKDEMKTIIKHFSNVSSLNLNLSTKFLQALLNDLESA